MVTSEFKIMVHLKIIIMMIKSVIIYLFTSIMYFQEKYKRMYCSLVPCKYNEYIFQASKEHKTS